MHYHHTHTFQAHPFAPTSLADTISRVTNPQYNKEAGIPSLASSNLDFAASTKIIEIPELQLIATIASIPDPPALSYAHDLPKLVHDWDFALSPQINGIAIPLKYWARVYRGHRPDIWRLKKEMWSQWRVSSFKSNAQ